MMGKSRQKWGGSELQVAFFFFFSENDDILKSQCPDGFLPLCQWTEEVQTELP